jgi:integrase
VAQERVASQDGVAPRTAIKRAYLLEQLRAIHDRPIAELTTPDFVQALLDIEAARDRRETAHRCGMFAGQIARYAVNRGYAPVNVLPDGQLRGSLKPVKVESHAAITDPIKFGNLLDKIELYQDFAGSRNHPSVHTALSLAPYLFVRPTELREMEWSEVSLRKAEWLIPASKTKMRRVHLVPLARQPLAILTAQHKLTGSGRYVLPMKGKDKPLSENGFREAFKMILPLMREQREPYTMHGFRSSASTFLNGELHFESALVEMQLVHVKGDRIAGIYDPSERILDRKTMIGKP